jgi:DNA-binding CsgD family transcriptional regulator
MSLASTIRPVQINAHNKSSPSATRATPWSSGASGGAVSEPKPERRPFSAGFAEPSDSARLSLLPFEEHHLEAALSTLTLREREVVLAICAGGTNDAIASRLCIALPTLRTHLMRLNQKLGTTSKGDVVRHAATILIEGYRRGELAPAART